MKWKFAIIVVMSSLFVGIVKADNPIMACYDISGVNCTSPSIDIGEDGKVHLCWQERRDGESFTCYRCFQPNSSPTPTYTPSLVMDVSNDAGLKRRNDYKTGQTSHIAVDHGDGLASVVFYQRNMHKYWGTEQSALFAANDINPVFVTPTPTCTGTPAPPNYPKAVDHLESVGGMAEHLQDSCVVYHPTLEEIVVFWSQHQRMNDYDHDIYCNYRDVVDPAGEVGTPITGWNHIVKASETEEWVLEFWPSVAVNNSGENDWDGEMYIVTEDFDVAKYTRTPVPTVTPGGIIPTPTPSPTSTPTYGGILPSPTPAHDDPPTDEDGALYFTRISLTPTPDTNTSRVDTTDGEKQHAAKRASIGYYFIDETYPDQDKHYLIVSYIEVWHWSTNYYLKFTKIDLGAEPPNWDDFANYTAIPVQYSPAGGSRPTLDVDSTGLFRCVYLDQNWNIYEINAEYEDTDWSTPQLLVSATSTQPRQNVDFKIDPLDDDVFYVAYDEKTDDGWRVYWEKFTN